MPALSLVWMLAKQVPAWVWLVLAILIGGGVWVGALKVQLAVCHKQRDSARSDVETAQAANVILSTNNDKLKDGLAIQSKSIDALVERGNKASAEAQRMAEEARKARAGEQTIIARLQAAMERVTPVTACPGDAGLDVVREGLK